MPVNRIIFPKSNSDIDIAIYLWYNSATSESNVLLRSDASATSRGNRIRVPSYPSNRKTDERTNEATAVRWEGVLVERSQAGRPVSTYSSWGGVKLT